MTIQKRALQAGTLIFSISIATFILSGIGIPQTKIQAPNKVSRQEIDTKCKQLQLDIDRRQHYLSTSKAMVMDDHKLIELEKKFESECKKNLKKK